MSTLTELSSPLPTPAEMAGWDKAAAAFGIPPALLMENASREAFHSLVAAHGDVAGREIWCFAGPGNNGGDALALSRHLLDAGARPTVFHTRPRTAWKGEAGLHQRLAARAGVPFVRLSPDATAASLSRGRAAPEAIVEGILGTGLSGPLRPEYEKFVGLVNALGRTAFVLGLDIPSGLSGLTGEPNPTAVRADRTVTFGAAKTGLMAPAAREFTGELNVRPIGIPARVMAEAQPVHRLLTRRILELLPRPQPAMHKGTAGHVLVAGGSRGLTGAPHLAALAALRAGAGLVTVACPGALAAEIKAGRPDVMTLPLEDGALWTPGMAYLLADVLGRFDALALGPGLGRAPLTLDFLRAILPLVDEAGIPLLLDADGLYHLADLGPEYTLPAHAVITPHPGEAARLLGRDAASVQGDRSAAAGNLARRHGATVILKGAGTLVTALDQPCYVSPFDVPNLAVAGSGDVLSGAIAALMARGLSPLDAAALGVYWHGLSGASLAAVFPARGNTASEIADALPHALEGAPR